MSSPGRQTKAFKRLLRDERGAGMVEYLILVGVIGIAAQTAFRAFGRSLAGKANEQAAVIAQLEDGSDCVGGLCMTRVEPADAQK